MEDGIYGEGAGDGEMGSMGVVLINRDGGVQ